MDINNEIKELSKNIYWTDKPGLRFLEESVICMGDLDIELFSDYIDLFNEYYEDNQEVKPALD